MLELRGVTPQTRRRRNMPPSGLQQAVSGIGGNPYVGTPDLVAEQFANLARGGVRGIAVSFVNYLNDAPYFCAEVLPRLARMGLRGRKRRRLTFGGDSIPAAPGPAACGRP